MVERQQNWLGQQRVDVPHLRSLESSVAADFDVLAGQMLAGKMALILKGFNIITTGAIGAPATNLKVRIADGLLMHYGASEAGSLFWAEANRADEQLIATNSKVTGSFTASQTNFIGLDLTRSADDSTADNVQFLEPVSDGEISKTVPLARTLDIRLVISTADFSSQATILPLAKVVTDSNNNVTSIQDARQMMFRLGEGGDNPNQYAGYTWPGTRYENTTGDVFAGGDKIIDNMKTWMDAVMTRLWEVGGGEHWYAASADRNVNMVWTGPAFTNGEHTEISGGNVHWKGYRFLWDNRSGYVNDVNDQTGNSAGLTDLANGECIYVDLDSTQFRIASWASTTAYVAGDLVLNDTNKAYECTVGGTSAGGGGPTGTGGAITDNTVTWKYVGPAAAKLTAAKAPLITLGAPTVPGSRHVLIWKTGGSVYTRGWRYPVGTLFTPATTTAQGVLKISRDYTGLDFVGASGLNDPVALSDRGGTITVPAIGNKGLVIKRFDGGANILEWQTAAGANLGAIANDSTVSIPPGVQYKYTSARSRVLHIPATAFNRTPMLTSELTNAMHYGSAGAGYHNDALTLSSRIPGQHFRLTGRADFHLPNGAVITGVTALAEFDWGLDSGTNQTVGVGQLSLFRNTYSAGAITKTRLNGGTGNFSSNGFSGQTITEIAITGGVSHTIDNSNSWYDIALEMTMRYAYARVQTGNLTAGTSGGGAMAVLRDGRVLVAGGKTGGGAVANAYIYDPLTGVMTAVTSMNHARSDFRLFTMQTGIVLAVGGHSDNGGVVGVGTCETYDPQTNAWTDLAGTLQNPINSSMILSPRGDAVFVLGGMDAGGVNTPRAFSVVNDSSGPGNLTNSPADRTACTLAWYRSTTNGSDTLRLAAIGGGANTGASSATFDSYDPYTPGWAAGTGTVSAAVNTPHVVTLPSGALLIVGGGAAALCNYAQSAAADTLTFTTLTAPPVNISNSFCFNLPDGTVLFLQGSSGLRSMRYRFQGTANANTGTFEVIADGDGTNIDDNGFTACPRIGNGGGDAVMLDNGEVIVMPQAGSKIYHMTPGRWTMQTSMRRPAFRLHGIRINYDYTEVTAEM